MKKKIVHLINHGNPHVGGAQKIVNEIHHRVGFESIILSFDYYCDRKISKSLSIFNFSVLLIYYFFIKILDKNVVFFIHHRFFLPFCFLFPSRVFFVCHSMFPDKTFFVKLLSKIKVIAVSNDVKQYLLSLNADLNVTVIQNGVKVNPSFKKLHKYALDDVVEIGYVGRVSQEKGICLLIKSFTKYLNLSKKRVSLKVVGDGPELNFLRKLYSDYVERGLIKFIGYSQEPFQYLRNSKFIIVPSFFEGFGIVAYEAILLNHKVVLSNIPPFEELILNFKADYFDLNEKSLIKAIERNISSEEEYQNYNLSSIMTIDKMIFYYDEIIRRTLED